jgi:hypothetical protein
LSFSISHFSFDRLTCRFVSRPASHLLLVAAPPSKANNGLVREGNEK